MFEELSGRIQSIFRKLRGYGRLGEKEVSAGLREIRVALLEADVHYRIVKDFVSSIEEKAIGTEVLQTLSPADTLLKIVYENLTELLGGSRVQFKVTSKERIISLVGLQGSGKTTTACKLALKYRKHRPLLVPCDLKRPAAFEQLQILANRAELDFFGEKHSPLEKLCNEAIKQAASSGNGLIILDTAGRLHIDDELMNELVMIKGMEKVATLLVADGTTGQDAVRIAKEFDDRVGLEGIILTKLDGDARGGAALSMRRTTGKPILFVGTGEKLEDLEDFYPRRMANRILGMGDIQSLAEKVEGVYDAKEDEKRLRNGNLTFDDFLKQFKALKKMGPLENLLKLLPRMPKGQSLPEAFDPKALAKVEAMIHSMTRAERANPRIIDGSRRKRIARGSGTSVADVNRLLQQFELAKKFMKQAGKKGQKFSIFE
jgi:signal recognition particle subunit SRP54